MTREETTRFLERWQQAWVARDPMTFASLYATDSCIRSPMFGLVQGRTAILESFRKLYTAFPDWTLAMEPPIIDGNRVAILSSVTATHSADFMGLPATGRKAQVSGVQVLRLGDGTVVEELRLYDFTALLVQVGVLRTKVGH